MGCGAARPASKGALFSFLYSKVNEKKDKFGIMPVEPAIEHKLIIILIKYAHSCTLYINTLTDNYIMY